MPVFIARSHGVLQDSLVSSNTGTEYDQLLGSVQHEYIRVVLRKHYDLLHKNIVGRSHTPDKHQVSYGGTRLSMA
jgi:hypothetical protein